MTPEKIRLEEDEKRVKHWKQWGPYLSERAWATVREDYSENGDVWNSFTHDMARSRAYVWGEDGIAGISDNHGRLCFAPTFWNGQDPILKERLFGLTNQEGNHGEDVKEYYFYLDNTPTHSYMRALYKYPQNAFPYAQLVEENKKRTLHDREFELADTGIFKKGENFDITIEYAKNEPDDLLIRIRAVNCGNKTSPLHLLPTLWFRNIWSTDPKMVKPSIALQNNSLSATHPTLGTLYLYFEGEAEPLFTENETNTERVFGVPNATPYIKDAFHSYIIEKKKGAISPEKKGTKAALHYFANIAPRTSCEWRLRMTNKPAARPFEGFDSIFQTRIQEADAFYGELLPKDAPTECRKIQRQAFAGMLWNKQFYHYVVEEWLTKNPFSFKPYKRKTLRNIDWTHLYNEDVLSLPDKWEYPCFFSWDSAFHTIPLALIDPEFAKRQLSLFVREWYMHPNGQLPADEWAFNNVNPPVHAWAAWRVYKIQQKMGGRQDLLFLESVFQKLLINFTWWVNRKDAAGRNVFQGGFLGMDNISVFNRNDTLPEGGTLYQSDATSWMGSYCLNMLTIALELAKYNPSYEDMASKFFEHFLYISDAINFQAAEKLQLWDQKDGFYYDLLQMPNGTSYPLQVRSMVGIIPLFAVDTLSPELLDRFKGFNKRLEWFLNNRSDLCEEVAPMRTPGKGGRRLLSIVNGKKLRCILAKLLDEKEFLSPYGIRSLSKYHLDHPYVLQLDGHEYPVNYEPRESTTRLFGGNSNWRGPIWFPLNMLIIESLQKFHHYFGDEFKVECPTGSGQMMTLWQVASEISSRLLKIFLPDEKGRRPMFGENEMFQTDPLWKELFPFNEYFHGETGEGLGASHQTGWTGLIAKLIQQLSEYTK